MQIKAVYPEQRTLTSGERVDSIKVAIETTSESIQALQDSLSPYEGYTEVMEHYLVLYKPPEKIALKEKLNSIAAALPDDIAVEHTDLYPAWAAGMALKANDRIQHDGGLYRVQQAHTAQSDWPPDTALSLFSRINAPGEIPAWVQGSYAKDVRVTHQGKTWESQVDNNVWEPGAVGVYDNIWKEV